jgi:hypothetical protein
MNALTLRHEQALVIGDGLTGLLAAQVLTRFFRQVVVAAQPSAVEQPPVIEQPPVAAPPYLLNGRDQQTLAALFPGLLADLVAAGAVRFNLGLHVAWSVNGRWRPRYHSAYDLIVCPLTLLIEAIRGRLVAETVVHWQTAGHLLPADLIIETDQQPDPAQTRPAPIAGAGRLYQGPAGRQTSWQMLVIEPDSPLAARRGAVVLPQAADQFYLALWGTAVDAPPLDEAGFLAFARSLPHSVVTEILRQATPLAAIDKLPAATWSAGPPLSPAHTVRLPRPGYLPNPLLGQPVGYALAGRAALLDSLVEADGRRKTEDGAVSPSSSVRFRHHLIQHLRPMSQLAQAEVQRWAGSDAQANGDLAAYLARVTASSLNSAPLLEALYAVQQMLEPATRLFEPDVVLQII